MDNITWNKTWILPKKKNKERKQEQDRDITPPSTKGC
jgi:hypothetical protein